MILPRGSGSMARQSGAIHFHINRPVPRERTLTKKKTCNDSGILKYIVIGWFVHAEKQDSVTLSVYLDIKPEKTVE